MQVHSRVVADDDGGKGWRVGRVTALMEDRCDVAFDDGDAALGLARDQVRPTATLNRVHMPREAGSAAGSEKEAASCVWRAGRARAGLLISPFFVDSPRTFRPCAHPSPDTWTATLARRRGLMSGRTSQPAMPVDLGAQSNHRTGRPPAGAFRRRSRKAFAGTVVLTQRRCSPSTAQVRGAMEENCGFVAGTGRFAGVQPTHAVTLMSSPRRKTREG